MSETELQKRPLLIPAAIAALMLFGALAPWPYGYYQLLRWVTCGVAVYVAFLAYAWEKKWATYLFGFIAVLFNPLLPIYLLREIWQPIDVICALLFVVVTFTVEKPVEQQRE
jgi:urea transporter